MCVSLVDSPGCGVSYDCEVMRDKLESGLNFNRSRIILKICYD